MKNLVIGYTTGVFDLFHVGHLNILKNAKSLCDYLIVGVTTDQTTFEMKKKWPIIPFNERLAIVESIIYVDKVVAKEVDDNIVAWNDLKFNVFIKGDDWKNTPKGNELEKKFSSVGVEIKYFPYTNHTSSTLLREILTKMNL